uniref:Uncharacterized protein n=1 Tax=Tanacetum cinerariifolium TaxID=118510 RepID=A0A6L2KYX6_TANCI|nr:hypothetical protein [Tanacetum cinerariifolium]
MNGRVDGGYLGSSTMVDAIVKIDVMVSSSELKEKLSYYENFTERLKEFQDAQLKVVNDKFDKLWLLTHGMELAIAKCLNSPEYLFALGIAISKAIKKGMQDGLADGITHGREGRVLTDDASIEAVMNILRLEEHLAARLGLNESQSYADQLMVPIHHSPDKTVIGSFALSLALDVSDARAWRIMENIMSHRSLFQDVFVLLAEPLSDAALTGMEGTSGAAPATADLTIGLSVTLASAGTVTLISVDDYGIKGTNDQSVVNENVVDEDTNPFSNVDDAKLNIPQ